MSEALHIHLQDRLDRTTIAIKRAIWLYFWLLIFEGALRKWFLPSLATPLLIIRDPVAIWILLRAYRSRMLKPNFYIVGAFFVTLISLITTVFVGHSNLSVAIYGARIFLIQFPLLFVIGKLFTYEDVIKIGQVILCIMPFMTLLIAIQFYSPQSAWVNRGVGGDMAGAGFSGAMGYLRPPGTFSFILGLANYYGLAAAYIFFFWLENKATINRWLLVVTTASLLAAIPLSISRTLLFEVVISMFFTLIISIRKPKYFPQISMAIFGGIFLISILSNFGFFNTAIEAFTSRFDAASGHEGGLKGTVEDRFLGGMISAVTESNSQSNFWGKGLGMGTNAGAKLMTGEMSFLISEGEWGRLIGEMGLLLGLGMIFLRVQLVSKMTVSSYKSLKTENFLPWLLLSFAFTNILQGQWAQPTALGFAILSGGLVIASLKKPSSLTNRII